MSKIYYSLVAYGGTVLVDFTQCSGNFQQITLDIIERLDVEKNTRMSYISAEYMFHIVIEDGIIYLCMADDSMGKSAPYAFLYEIKRRFTSGSLKERAPNCYAYELRRDFESVLGQQMKRYNKGDFEDPNGRIDSIQQDVTEVKSIMTQNIEKVLQRGEKLNILIDKTENLERSSASFARASKKLQRKMWWQNKKVCIILVLIALIVVAVVTVVILIEEDVIK